MCFCAALSGALARSAFALTAITTYFPGFRLQRWVGGLLCFFLNTSFLATAGMPFSGEEVLMVHAQCAPHARAGFLQS